MTVRIQEAASLRLDDIYLYTCDRWGEAQADRYITGMFEAFERIDARGVASKPIPAEFGVEGFFFRYEHHFVYWRRLSDGDIGIVAILHERMHQIDRFKEDFRD
ncbi:type II toxin-antitoxin system RelE/ParE family toxin [Amaricoccus sp.]|uniref:type II toxin-antitoxin system RelE/ParE family toxin n=1 Tax=Amaricoccus sp. TaxID=1872485 RepID=UPI002623C5FB|nr:type II toxin-antitoxin system RelE/ParE family toxin [Amaricoccus sp.]HRO12139.1 type II toxin-antitoxin system RelE/ParE family toxin [Amaricoccus sp.]